MTPTNIQLAWRRDASLGFRLTRLTCKSGAELNHTMDQNFFATNYIHETSHNNINLKHIFIIIQQLILLVLRDHQNNVIIIWDTLLLPSEVWADESKQLEAHIHLPEYFGCMNELIMQQGSVGWVWHGLGAIPAAKAEFWGRNRPNKVQGLMRSAGGNKQVEWYQFPGNPNDLAPLPDESCSTGIKNAEFFYSSNSGAGGAW